MRFKILFFILFSTTVSLFADFSFQDILEDYVRLEELSGKREISLSNFNTDDLYLGDFSYWETISLSKNILQNDGFSLFITTPQLFSSYNTARAYGGSDRVAFQGKGINLSLISGVQFDSKHISINFIPEFFFSENSDFDIVETSYSSGYGDYWTMFDNLQRFGDEAYYDFSWGQSSIKINYFNTSISLSTENVTTGFSKRNSFLLSDNADGFLHVDLGTEESITIKYFGDLEAKILWGVIEESEYFNDDADDDYGWLSGMFVGYSPFFTENLMLGFNHLYVTPLSEWSSSDLIAGIPGVDSVNTPGDSGDNDMMVSLTYRWVFPEVGFEVYGEWARNDNYSNFNDLYNFLEHTSGYTLGFSKCITEFDNQNALFLSYEYTNSMQQSTKDIRAAGPWYRHSWAGWKQGYTNNGQILGLDIGPGSESMWAELKWLFNKGSIAITVERVILDKDYYYSLATSGEDLDFGVFSQFNAGISTVYNFNDIILYGELLMNSNSNTNFESLNSVYNPHIEFGLSYNF